MSIKRITAECASKIFADLEAAGLIVKTGEFRPNRLGQLTPVYVSTVSLGLLTQEEEERRLRLLNERD